MSCRTLIAASVLLRALVPPAAAETPPCRPCAGLSIGDPGAVAAVLATLPHPEDHQPLVVRWAAGTAEPEAVALQARAVADAGGAPWIVLDLAIDPPVADHLDQLAAELDAVAGLAAAAPPTTRFQVGWAAAGWTSSMADYAFLLKRASVAVKGAQPAAQVLPATLPPDPAVVEALYAEEVAAYVDAVVVLDPTPAELDAVAAALLRVDAGKPVVVDGRPFPADSWAALAVAAADAAGTAAATLFEVPAGRQLAAADLVPFEVLAQEFAGDLAYDPYSSPTGGAGGWSFVRSDDLGLRVIVDRGAADRGPFVTFSDPTLRSPLLVTAVGGVEAAPGRRTTTGFEVDATAPSSVAVLRLERPSAAELGGFERRLEVEGEYSMPVEEILRRLQAREDHQRRRVAHYEAHSTQHLRYRPGQSLVQIEATFTGPIFYRRDGGFDWVWDSFHINGVRWKDRIPELPLLQPVRATETPLEITLDRSYRYRLRRTDVVRGRDCWVVDFEPAGEPAPGASLWRGTVWIDREHYLRVRSRALQLGLAGDVISNEETQEFEPLTADGGPADWGDPQAFVLPVRTVGQQIQSILTSAVQVEKETLLSEVRFNRDGFSERLAAAHASDATMLRDTPEGLRYLEKDEQGERVVQEGFDESKLFLLGGVYYDKGLDYPLPLAGVNYFDNDFLGRGQQVNLFFGGVLVNGNWADPDLAGSRFDAGARLFGFFFPRTQELYRSGQESPAESIENTSARAAVFLGRPLGAYAKVDLTYGVDWNRYERADDTADEFVLPQDGLTHSLRLGLTYTRAGWRFVADGRSFSRSHWEFWGLPGNTEYDPDQEDYEKWSASLTRTFWLGRFMKLGIEAEHVGGSNLDRFSKYDFNTFGGSRVAGYQGGLVTAAKADLVHVDYGFNVGDVLRVGVRGDAAWATDEATGLDRELLAGVSFNGTVIGPWQTIVNFDLGVPLAGPADGFTASIAFLKLFR